MSTFLYHQTLAPNGQKFDRHMTPSDIESMEHEGWVDNPALFGNNLWRTEDASMVAGIASGRIPTDRGRAPKATPPIDYDQLKTQFSAAELLKFANEKAADEDADAARIIGDNSDKNPVSVAVSTSQVQDDNQDERLVALTQYLKDDPNKNTSVNKLAEYDDIFKGITASERDALVGVINNTASEPNLDDEPMESNEL